jgi:hypothetical protein
MTQLYDITRTLGPFVIISAVTLGVKYLYQRRTKKVSADDAEPAVQREAGRGEYADVVTQFASFLSVAGLVMTTLGLDKHINTLKNVYTIKRTYIDLMSDLGLVEPVRVGKDLAAREVRNPILFDKLDDDKGFLASIKKGYTDKYAGETCRMFYNVNEASMQKDDGDNMKYCDTCGWEKADHPGYSPDDDDGKSKWCCRLRWPTCWPFASTHRVVDDDLEIHTVETQNGSTTFFSGMGIKEIIMNRLDRIKDLACRRRIPVALLLTLVVTSVIFIIYRTNLLKKFYGDEIDACEEERESAYKESWDEEFEAYKKIRGLGGMNSWIDYAEEHDIDTRRVYNKFHQQHGDWEDYAHSDRYNDDLGRWQQELQDTETDDFKYMPRGSNTGRRGNRRDPSEYDDRRRRGGGYDTEVKKPNVRKPNNKKWNLEIREDKLRKDLDRKILRSLKRDDREKRKKKPDPVDDAKVVNYEKENIFNDMMKQNQIRHSAEMDALRKSNAEAMQSLLAQISVLSKKINDAPAKSTQQAPKKDFTGSKKEKGPTKWTFESGEVIPEAVSHVSLQNNKLEAVASPDPTISNKSTSSKSVGKGREAAIAGAISIQTDKDPGFGNVWAGPGQDHNLGFAQRVAIGGGVSVCIFPKHFLEFEDLEIRSSDGSKVHKVDRSKIILHPNNIDICGFVSDEKLNQIVAQYKIGAPREGVTLALKTKRNGKWVTNPSVNPWVRTNCIEQKYWSTSESGDCGAGVFCDGGLIGMHVGTNGGTKGNLFVFYAGPVEAFIKSGIHTVS